MIIKQARTVPLPARLTKNRRKLIWTTFVAAYSALLFLLGAVVHRTGVLGTIRPYLKDVARISANYIHGLSADPRRVFIDMKLEAVHRLESQRAKALRDGVMLTSGEDFVPATLTLGEKTVRAKVRLKGDLIVHVEGDKWSFRVKVRGDETLFGTREFSLHHPKTRNYLFESLYHTALRREGLLSLRYEFVAVTLNGRDLGIYAMEEHFAKQLPEHNRKREGPIVRFSEDAHWKEFAYQSRHFFRRRANGVGSFMASLVDGFQTPKTRTDEVFYDQYTKAVNLLELFRRGTLRTSEVFDTKALATYFALVDLLGAEHGARWPNIRFYYDPLSSKLEPVGFDSNAGKPTMCLRGLDWGLADDGRLISRKPFTLRARIFSDDKFLSEYLGELERVSKKSYLDALFRDVGVKLDEQLAILHSEFPSYHFSPGVVYRNGEYIRSVLNPVAIVHAHYSESASAELSFLLGNVQALPVEVTAVEVEELGTFPVAEKTILSPRRDDRPVEYREVSFRSAEPFRGGELVPDTVDVLVKIAGTSRVFRVPVVPHPLFLSTFRDRDIIRRVPDLREYSFLSVDEKSKEIRIGAGNWEIDRHLILPSGYTVRCGPGTSLDLRNSAIILSYSPLAFLGEPQREIRVHSSDGTGQGLAVLNAREPSELRHVVFENLDNPEHDGWALTGAVTFYESPISISGCRFLQSRCEDALNIVRSSFDIDNCVLSDSFSDALDADFCDGSIRNVVFTNSGNDGIDVSGSAVELSDVDIIGAGDKGISAGEGSHVRVDRITVSGARVGLASKDLSVLIAEEASLSECDYGLAAYQKKSEFGPSRITVKSLQLDDVRREHLLEMQSETFVDGRKLVENITRAGPLLYPAPSIDPKSP